MDSFGVVLMAEYEVDDNYAFPKGTRIREYISPDGKYGYLMAVEPDCKIWVRITKQVKLK